MRKYSKLNEVNEMTYGKENIQPSRKIFSIYWLDKMELIN